MTHTTYLPECSRLSERELQVLHGLLEGLSSHQMGERMGCSWKTVNSYRYRIFDALNVKGESEIWLLIMGRMAARIAILSSNIEPQEVRIIKGASWYANAVGLRVSVIEAHGMCIVAEDAKKADPRTIDRLHIEFV